MPRRSVEIGGPGVTGTRWRRSGGECGRAGRPVALGLEGLCKHGQRLLSLGRHLAGCRERLLDLICFHLDGPEDNLTRLPGHRVRRFYIERRGRQGLLHFFEGTPTAVVL